MRSVWSQIVWKIDEKWVGRAEQGQWPQSPWSATEMKPLENECHGTWIVCKKKTLLALEDFTTSESG